MSSSGTSRTLRDAPPAHYIVKIEAFSLLANRDIGKYDSGVFEVGGYKWKLCLYPNGRGIKDHVSLFLMIADTSSLSLNWEANVNFKMFVLDHNKDKFLTIQENDGKVWRFKNTRLEWGYSQLLSHDELGNSGYLVEDKFTFGVEISLVNYTGRSETFYRIKHPNDATFSWPIHKFPEKTREQIYSDVFIVAERKWKLVLYPMGHKHAKDSHLSVYLKLADPSSLFPDRKIFVDFILRIKNHFGGKQHKNHASRVDYWFSSSKFESGILQHTLRSDILGKANGFLSPDDKDSITIEVKFMSIAQTNDQM